MNKIFALIAAAMTLAACSTSDITENVSNNSDSNTVTVASVTRAADDPATTPTTMEMNAPFLLTNLTQKDKAGYNYEAIFEYNVNQWAPKDGAKVMWYGSGENEFHATYPTMKKSGYVLGNINFDRFMIPGYQYSYSDSIPDWMRATKTVARSIVNGTTAPLDLNFKHMLSKVTVKVNCDGTTIDGKAIDYAVVNKIFTRVQYCEAVTGNDGNVTINPYQQTDYGTDGLYVWLVSNFSNKQAYATAIVAPGAYTDIAKATIYSENYNTSEEVVISYPNGFTLEAGKHYTFTVNSFASHNEATISSVEVKNWETQTIISEQPAEKVIP